MKVNGARSVNKRCSQRCPQQGIQQGKQTPGNVWIRGKRYDSRQEMRCKVIDRHDEAEDKSEGETLKRQLIRQQLGFRIGEDEAQQQKTHNAALECCQAESELSVTGKE